MRRVLGQDPRLNSGDLEMGRTHMWARRTYKGLDIGWRFGIVAAVFRLVHCGVTPGVDLFCLRGFLLGKDKVSHLVKIYVSLSSTISNEVER